MPSATFAGGPVDGESSYRVGDLIVTFMLPGEATNGTFAMARMDVPPGSGNMPLHAHPAQETLHVLEGVFTVLSAYDAPPRVVGAGEFVHVPADTPHGFTNTGDTEGRLLIIAQPAGVLEPAVMELGTPLQGEEPSPAAEESSHLEHAQAVFERYGWRLILPPEAAQPRA